MRQTLVEYFVFLCCGQENKPLARPIQQTISELLQTIRELQQTKMADQQTISELLQTIRELRQTKMDDQQTISELRQTKMDDQQTISEFRQTISEFRQTISELQQTIMNLSKSPSDQSSSTLGKEEMFIETYEDYKIYCNVPAGTWQTHPGLYFAPFSEFRELEVPDKDFYHMARYAAQFVHSMTQPYSSEIERSDKVVEIFEEVFDGFTFRGFGTKEYRTDITFMKKKRKRGHNYYLLLGNIEIKNGLGLTNMDANLQNVHYYRKIANTHLSGMKPFLLISLVGRDYLQAFGAVTTESKHISCSPLCPPLSMLFELKLTSTIEEVARFLYRTLSKIDEYYMSRSEKLNIHIFSKHRLLTSNK